MKQEQSGFTLVEIAIVLVIIGLLLGGILKGQELINSARVRNLADTASGIQAAYFGFLDRYRRIPGDWEATAASTGIGVTINNPAADANTNNGRIDNPTGGAATTYKEPNAMWEQLAAAGFIQGSYTGTGAEPDNTGTLAPLNAFNTPIIVGRTPDFQGATSSRLNLVIGRNIPVDVMRELDVKVDDSKPTTGSLRQTLESPTVFAYTNNWGGSADCIDASNEWDVINDEQDCNAALLF
jgi:prepilin-type N-terminal cleavage/methylation domain-containing protein